MSTPPPSRSGRFDYLPAFLFGLDNPIFGPFGQKYLSRRWRRACDFGAHPDPWVPAYCIFVLEITDMCECDAV